MNQGGPTRQKGLGAPQATTEARAVRYQVRFLGRAAPQQMEELWRS